MGPWAKNNVIMGVLFADSIEIKEINFKIYYRKISYSKGIN